MNKNLKSQYIQKVNTLQSLYNLREKTNSTEKYKKQNFLNFLKLIGNPQDKLKFIYISGTSGKTTTSFILQQILYQANLKTGLWTSPHLTTFLERIKVNDKFISIQELIRLIDKIIPILENFILQKNNKVLSFGQISFALGLLYFVKQKCDYVIVEAGCGGFNDFTNIIPKTKISIITNISKDHIDTFGSDLKYIAKEKSGIIKNHCTFITTEQNNEFLEIFKQQCKKTNSKFQQIKLNYQIIHKSSSFIYKNYEFKTNLIQNYQIPNILLAIETAKHLKIPIKMIKASIKNIKIPARFEIMQTKPLVILDSAHNPLSLKASLEHLKQKITEYKPNKIIAILSLNYEYRIKPILKQLQKISNIIILTKHNNIFKKIPSPNKFSNYFENTDFKFFLQPEQALNYALKNLKQNDILFITGSIYLAGELRKKWISEDFILKNRTLFKN